MRTLRRNVSVIAVLALLVAPGLAAQKTPRGLVEVREAQRGGFWLGFGLGAGGESFDFRDGRGYVGELYRPTVALGLGGTVNQHLRLGGEVLAWFDEEGDAVESLTSILFVGQLYPIRSSGLYLKGGLGLGRDAVDFRYGFEVGETGFAGLVGAGWELRLGRKVFLNPSVSLVQHRYDVRGSSDYRVRLVNFGLGVLFQSR